MAFETHEEYVTNEIEKQKRKLRDINDEVIQVHQLIRLIIQVNFCKMGHNSMLTIFKFGTKSFQKMEIKTEADDVDEGVSPCDSKLSSANLHLLSLSSGRWTSPKIRKKLKHTMSFNKSS